MGLEAVIERATLSRTIPGNLTRLGALRLEGSGSERQVIIGRNDDERAAIEAALKDSANIWVVSVRQHPNETTHEPETSYACYNLPSEVIGGLTLDGLSSYIKDAVVNDNYGDRNKTPFNFIELHAVYFETSEI